jgi:hypothetical protein
MAIIERKLGAPPGRIVHSVPGRIRLRYDRAEESQALLFASQLAGHQAVTAISLRPRTRSLTVHFDPDCSFSNLTSTLPPVDSTPALAQTARGRDINWSRLAFNCLLSAIPFGPVAAVAVSLLTSIAEDLGSGQDAQPAEA